jgi:hypothetical protein
MVTPPIWEMARIGASVDIQVAKKTKIGKPKSYIHTKAVVILDKARK